MGETSKTGIFIVDHRNVYRRGLQMEESGKTAGTACLLETLV